MPTYYHYTNEAGYNGIRKDKFIEESKKLDDGDDAQFGTGVYLTSLPPSKPKETIITECWGPNAVDRILRTGRVEYYIGVTLHRNEVQSATQKPNVYLHKGRLHLQDGKWKGGKV